MLCIPRAELTSTSTSATRRKGINLDVEAISRNDEKGPLNLLAVELSVSERPKVPSARLSAEPSVVYSTEAEPSVVPTDRDLRFSKKTQKLPTIHRLF